MSAIAIPPPYSAPAPPGAKAVPHGHHQFTPVAGQESVAWVFEAEATIVGPPQLCIEGQRVNGTMTAGYPPAAPVVSNKTAGGSAFPFRPPPAVAPVGNDDYTKPGTFKTHAAGLIRWIDGPGLYGLPTVRGGNRLRSVDVRGHFEAVVNSNSATGSSCKCVWNIEYTKAYPAGGGAGTFTPVANAGTGVPGGVPAGMVCRTRAMPWPTGTGTFP